MKESRELPEASEAVENDRYVNDVLIGAENESNAITLQKSLDAMMKAGGFKLTKCASNSEFVCTNIQEDERAPTSTIDFNQSESLKALGICWDTKEDNFSLILLPESSPVMTQRPKEVCGVLHRSCLTQWVSFCSLSSVPRLCFKSCEAVDCSGMTNCQMI